MRTKLIRIDLDRLLRLLALFARAGRTGEDRPTKSDLAEHLGIDSSALGGRALEKASDHRLERIARTAAELLGLDPDRFLAWLRGGVDSGLEQQITDLEEHWQCNACSRWTHVSDMELRLSKCLNCLRPPRVNAWIGQVDARVLDQQGGPVPHALKEAWERARAGGAITMARLAVLVGADLKTFLRQWEAAGLPRRPAGGRKPIAYNSCCSRSRRRRTPKFEQLALFLVADESGKLCHFPVIPRTTPAALRGAA